MQLDAIIEITIGLVVTWLIISMTTSQIQEFIVEVLGSRSKFLEKRLLEMFKDRALLEKFYQHPLIDSLSAKTFLGRKRKPTDIPNPIFAKAAVDIFLNAGRTEGEIPANSMDLATMKQSILKSMGYLKAENEDLARVVNYLTPRLEDAEAKVEETIAEYRKNVESWFDITMVEATKLYRKYASAIAMGLGIGLAVAFNVDSIYIVNQLWRDPTLRQTIVAQAGNIKPDDQINVTNAKTKLEELSLPVGWNEETTLQNTGEVLSKVLGFLITGVAASLGAPFWFDILNRLLGLKSAQKPKKEEKE
jgi:hypothetical protein